MLGIYQQGSYAPDTRQDLSWRGSLHHCVLCDEPDHAVERGFALLFRQSMLFGKFAAKMLHRRGEGGGLGGTTGSPGSRKNCFRVAVASPLIGRRKTNSDGAVSAEGYRNNCPSGKQLAGARALPGRLAE